MTRTDLRTRPARMPRRAASLRAFALATSGLVLAALASPAVALADDETPKADGAVRWAALLPFVASALRGTDGGFGPVAEVRTSMRQAPPEGVSDLGSAHHPNFEVLLGARPDVVVGDRVLHAALASKLEATGLEVLLIDTSSIDGTLEGLRTIARRVGAGDALDLDLQRVNAALAEVKLAGAPEVLPLFGVPGRYLLVTKGTWIGDLIVHCGGRLTSPEGLAQPDPEKSGDGKPRRSHPGYVQVSDEWLTAQRPDVVLLLSHGDPRAIEATFRQRVAEGGVWAPLAKSTGGRIHALPPGLFATNPGLGLPEAAQVIDRVVSAPPQVASGPAS